MRKPIAINPNGYAIGLDSPLAMPFKTTALPHGVYLYTLKHYGSNGDVADFVSELYAPRELYAMNYQLPMPEFGV